MIWALAAVFATPASAAESKLYSLPPATHGSALTVGPDETVWFAGSRGSPFESGAKGFVGRLAPDGTVSEFALPHDGRAGAPVSGLNGDAWLPVIYKDERGYAIPRIGHMSSSGQLQEHPLGDEEGEVRSVAMLNGDVWFAVTRGGDAGARSAIGRIATSADGAVQEFALEPHCSAEAITAAAGAVWFAESCMPRSPSGRLRPSANIGRIDPAGQIVRYPLGAQDAPASITAAPDGTVWFGATRHDSSIPRIGRITPAGDFAIYRVPDSWPTKIAIGPDGRLWFPSSFGGASFRALRPIDIQGRLGKPICIGPCYLAADGLTSGPNGRLWFSAGRNSTTGGGGMTQIIADENAAKEAGSIGWLVPPPPTKRKFVVAKPVKLPPPRARTTAAYGVDGASAVIAGVINPRGQATVYRFKWGLTKSYGHIDPVFPEEVWYGNEPREVEEALLCLRPNTTYHYRIVAYNRSGKTFGGDRTFTTKRLGVSRKFAYSECPGGKPVD